MQPQPLPIMVDQVGPQRVSSNAVVCELSTLPGVNGPLTHAQPSLARVLMRVSTLDVRCHFRALHKFVRNRKARLQIHLVP